MGIVTVEKLENADKDADSLEKFISGSDTENVKTRKAKEYPTLANAVRQVIETGGFEPFATEEELLKSTPTLDKKAAKALDTKKVWLWDGVEWIDTGSSEYDLASNERKELIDQVNSDFTFSITDKYGFVSIYGTKDSINFHDIELFKVEANIPQLTEVDKHGFAVVIQNQEQQEIQGSTAIVDQLNTRALALSAFSKQKDRFCSGLKKGINHLIVYGQSLSLAAEGAPALTTENKFSSLKMIGDSVRGKHTGSTTTYTPHGDLVLNNLIATNDLNTEGVIDESNINDAGLSSTPRGECMSISAVNMLKAEWNRNKAVIDDEDVIIAVTAVGQGSRNIASLSKGASPEIYNRVPTVATAVKGLADAQGKDYNYLGMIFAQGEQDYTDATNQETYETLKRQLINDVDTDVRIGIANQDDKGLFVFVTAGGQFTNDVNGLIAGNTDLAISNDMDCVTVSTAYSHVTDKGGHLTANGYRQIGCTLGKILIDKLIYRKKASVLKPLTVSHIDSKVYLTFDVPVPPLRWGKPYQGFVEQSSTQKGFSAQDENGSIPLTAEIIADAVVELTLLRSPIGTLTIFCGDKTVNGGCVYLKDSDDTVSPYRYIYKAVDNALANISTLNNKPYDLSNWCIPFSKKSKIMDI